MSRSTTDNTHRMITDQSNLRVIAHTLVLTTMLIFSPTTWSETLYSEFEISVESLKLDNLSLGDEPSENQLKERAIQLEFNLEYSLTRQIDFFLGGSFVNKG
ncbi:MAG: hypothetical protein ACI845_001533 [Gammaproteobacteria bacterium]|jgi:hypothetical protein